MAAIGLHVSAFTVHIPGPRPVAQSMVGPRFIVPLRHHIENSVDAEKLFRAAAKGRIGMKDLAALVFEERAVAGESLSPDWSNENCKMPRWRRHLLVKVIAEVAVDRTKPKGSANPCVGGRPRSHRSAHAPRPRRSRRVVKMLK